MRKSLRELPTFTVGGFSNLNQLASALVQHEMGQFQMAADLCDVMSRDDRCSAVERTRIQGLLGLDLDFTPAKEDQRSDRLVKETKETWPSMFPEDASYQWTKWGLWMGIGVGENVVDTTSVPGRWIPRLKVWHPRNVRWDWQQRVYKLRTETEEVDLLPDDPQWCLFTPYGYERGWMGGLVRNLASSWLFRQWTLRDWGRWSEVHGQPIKLAVVPEAAEEEDKERYHREVSNLGSESTLRAVDGGEGRKFDLQFREPVARSFESFNLQMNLANANIAICVLGHNLTTEVKSGSFAAAKVGDAVRTDIRASDAKLVSNAVREGILKRWAKWNFGDAELAPYPKYAVEPDINLKDAAQGLLYLGQAITALRDAGGNPDVTELLEQYGVPSHGPLDDAELLERQRQAAPPPADGQPSPEEPKADVKGEPTRDTSGTTPQAEA